MGQYVGCFRGRWHDRDAATGCRQATQNVALCAKINGNNVALRRLQRAIAFAQGPSCLIPSISLTGAHLFGQIHPFKAWPGFCVGNQSINVWCLCTLKINKDSRWGAFFPDNLGQCAGINTGDGHLIPAAEPSAQFLGRPPIAGVRDIGPQYSAQRERRPDFVVFIVGANIPNVGERKGNQLLSVTRVCQNFLIARQRRIEAKLADLLGLSAKPFSPKNMSTAQHQYSACIRWNRHLGHGLHSYKRT